MKNRFLLAAALILGLSSTSAAGDLSLDGRGARYEKRTSERSYNRGDRRVSVIPRRSYGRRTGLHGTWIPGHHKTIPRRTWVPGYCDRIWVEPVYETRYDDCNEPYTVLVYEGYWKNVSRPGHYEVRYVKVWVPGGWRRSYGRR